MLVAICVVVIAFLVPLAHRSRDKDTLARCKDHLRAIGVSLRQYAADSGGALPVSPTVQNPHLALVQSLKQTGHAPDGSIFYCPAETKPDLQYSPEHFTAGVIGYYYYSAAEPSSDASLSKFLRAGLTWPRELNTTMPPNTWLMSDIWLSGVPTAHSAYHKGINYLKLDGSVDFVSESPRKEFH